MHIILTPEFCILNPVFLQLDFDMQGMLSKVVEGRRSSQATFLYMSSIKCA
jgi:hypothetical protein